MPETEMNDGGDKPTDATAMAKAFATAIDINTGRREKSAHVRQLLQKYPFKPDAAEFFAQRFIREIAL